MEPLRTTLTAECAREHVDSHVRFFSDPKGAIRIERGSEWRGRFPENPGVYCVYEDHVLIYAGETGSLKGRMRDLLETRNHTLRRQLGSTKFGSHTLYRAATASVKFPDEIEILLTEFMLDHLTVKALPVSLGRKEIEERLLDQKAPKYNIRLRRGEVVDAPGF